MRKHLRQILQGAAIAAACILVFLIVYSWMLPRISYRRLVVDVTSENVYHSARVVHAGDSRELTDKQQLAVASWLAEYRSENKGIKHTADKGPYELWLDCVDADGAGIVLYLDQNGIVFPGVLGNYRIEVDSNELYDLAVDVFNG